MLHTVTPYGGVWIEIEVDLTIPVNGSVTPYGGVWIEMLKYSLYYKCNKSRLMEACGLK